jgi:hypothetical protein
MRAAIMADRFQEFQDGFFAALNTGAPEGTG